MISSLNACPSSFFLFLSDYYPDSGFVKRFLLHFCFYIVFFYEGQFKNPSFTPLLSFVKNGFGKTFAITLVWDQLYSFDKNKGKK
jgi:hypothetical protein